MVSQLVRARLTWEDDSVEDKPLPEGRFRYLKGVEGIVHTRTVELAGYY